MTIASIFGVEGTGLSRAERSFFRDVRPWGFILFKRNVESPEQVRALTAALRESIDRPDAPILIDQEGGRVQRMGPPHWPKYPPGRAYGDATANDPLARRELARLGARLIAHDLASVGVNVDCLPLLDVPLPDADPIIGDRAYGFDVDTVSQVGRAVAEGLIAGGVLPVIKHIPGHGRAMADSHIKLPIVETPYETLREIDFRPFKALSDMPLGMSAHVVYTAIDPKRPATQSRTAIRRVIREEIGFDGLLMTDDLSMKALGSDFTDRSRRAIAAGCDMILHCNGQMDEMKAVAKGCGELKGKARRRADAAMKRLAKVPEPFDVAEGRARFEAAFA